MTQPVPAPTDLVADVALPLAFDGPELRTPFWRFLLLAGLWLALAAFAADVVSRAGIVEALLLALVLSLPIALRWALSAQTRQHDRLRRIAPASRLRRWLSGPFWRVLIWLVLAQVAAAWLIVQLWLQPALLGWAAAAAPMVLIAHRWVGRAVARRIAQPWTSAAATWTATVLASLILTVAALALAWAMPQADAPATLAEARAALPQIGATDTLVGILLSAGQFMAALGTYAVALGSRADADIGLGLVLLAELHKFGLLWLIATAFSAFLLDRRDLERALLPLGAGAARKRRLLGAAMLPVALVLPTILLGAPMLEGRVRESGADAAVRELVTKAEVLDGQFYKPGTLAQLAALRRLGEGRVEAARDAVRQATRASFDRVRANVDPYLDFHYSLKGEAMRIMTGWDEEKLSAKVAERLNEGVDHSAVDPSLARLNEAAAYVSALADAQQQLLEANRIEPKPGEKVEITSRGAWADLRLDRTLPLDPISFKGRLRASAVVGGLAGGATAGLVIGRAVSARAAGSAAGAAAGSVAPLAGTLAGVVVGTTTGVVVDYALLKWNERETRPEMRAALMAAIDEVERKALASIG
ncbi:MAG: hypothetical protein ACK4Z0_05150 [Sphingomonadaceae bacterium]